MFINDIILNQMSEYIFCIIEIAGLITFFEREARLLRLKKYDCIVVHIYLSTF